MPVKKQAPSTGPNGLEKLSFVSCELSDEQRDYIRSNLPTMKQVVELIEQELAGGYKCTLSYDEEHDTYCAYMMRRDDNHDNSKMMLTSRAPTLVAVLAVTLYKHVTVLERKWFSKAKSNSKPWS